MAIPASRKKVTGAGPSRAAALYVLAALALLFLLRRGFRGFSIGVSAS